MEKFIYLYRNNSGCALESFDEWDLFDDKIQNYVGHSKLVSKKTINKEKSDNKYLHIFKKWKNANGNDVWRWFASECIN